jgi:hypothetical protein
MSEIRYTPNDESTLGNVITRQWETEAEGSSEAHRIVEVVQ